MYLQIYIPSVFYTWRRFAIIIYNEQNNITINGTLKSTTKP